MNYKVGDRVKARFSNHFASGIVLDLEAVLPIGGNGPYVEVAIDDQKRNTAASPNGLYYYDCNEVEFVSTTSIEEILTHAQHRVRELGIKLSEALCIK